MAYLCKSCGKIVDGAPESCPYCAAGRRPGPPPSSSAARPLLAIVLGTALLAAGVALGGGKDPGTFRLATAAILLLAGIVSLRLGALMLPPGDAGSRFTQGALCLGGALLLLTTGVVMVRMISSTANAIGGFALVLGVGLAVVGRYRLFPPDP